MYHYTCRSHILHKCGGVVSTDSVVAHYKINMASFSSGLSGAMGFEKVGLNFAKRRHVAKKFGMSVQGIKAQLFMRQIFYICNQSKFTQF